MYFTRDVVAVAAAMWLFTDAARVWGPSLITIFGQAASTPAEIIGMFALACFLVALLIARYIAQPWAGVTGAVAVMAMMWTSGPGHLGGQAQLCAATVALVLSAAWLCQVTATNASALPAGVALGWYWSSVTHAALGTWGAVWREDVWAAVALIAPILVLVTAGMTYLSGRTVAPGNLSRRVAWFVFPLLMVAGVTVVNVGRASAIDSLWGPMAVVAGCVLALCLAGRATRTTRLLAAVIASSSVAASLMLTATVNGSPGTMPPIVLLAHFLGPAAIVLLLQHTPETPERATSVAIGSLGWVLLLFAYYAGYDLGYHADVVLVAVTVVAAIALASGSVPVAVRFAPRFGLGALLVGIALVVAGPFITIRPESPMLAKVLEPLGADGSGTPSVQVAAYNLRMGYGMNGRFDPAAVAQVFAGKHVALVSEVDRGWLLNGGQDDLAILARLTKSKAYFNPAADPVWGDAVLTRLPVSQRKGTALPSYGAVTGAGMQSVLVNIDDATKWWFISTHVQPTTTQEDGTLAQVRAVEALAKKRAATGNPVVLGGDFNLEPGSPSWNVLVGGSLFDACSANRPMFTFDPELLDQQLDHFFATTDLTVECLGSVKTTASDHLPITATFSPAS